MTSRSAARRTIKIVYAIRTPEVRDEFLKLMDELRTVTRKLMRLAGADDGEYSLSEIRDLPGRFEETIKFKDESQRLKFDDLYCQDRTATTLQGLLNELLDASKSDFAVTGEREPALV
jgi:hypothetical protein